MVCQGLNEEYAKIGVEVFKAFSDDIFGRIEILMAERHERRMNESSWWAIHNRASHLHFLKFLFEQYTTLLITVCFFSGDNRRYLCHTWPSGGGDIIKFNVLSLL